MKLKTMCGLTCGIMAAIIEASRLTTAANDYVEAIGAQDTALVR